MYEHFFIVPYDFDTQNITESDIRDITRQHYDYSDWLKNNAKASYAITNQYMSVGICVSFEDEQDCQNFMDYTANCYWIFLHN